MSASSVRFNPIAIPEKSLEQKLNYCEIIFIHWTFNLEYFKAETNIQL